MRQIHVSCEKLATMRDMPCRHAKKQAFPILVRVEMLHRVDIVSPLLGAALNRCIAVLKSACLPG